MKYTVRLQYGNAPVVFSSDRVELASALSHIYRPFLVDQEDGILSTVSENAKNSPPDTDCSPWRSELDGEEYEQESFDVALRELEDAIADSLLEAASDCLVIHAGAVCNSESTFLIVGPSGSGKTTTTLEFLRRGYRYITDEFTVIEPCGTAIRPFPRTATRKFNSLIPAGTALEVDEESGYRSHMLPDVREALTARELGKCKIIFPTHASDASPEARLLDSAQLCALLLPSIFDFEGNEKELWPALSNLVTASQSCKLDYKNAETDLDVALTLFE